MKYSIFKLDPLTKIRGKIIMKTKYLNDTLTDMKDTIFITGDAY